MAKSWYQRCIPKVAEAKALIEEVRPLLSEVPGVKRYYVFGSLAENYDNDLHRIKDIDIAAQVPFNSEDLISIRAEDLSTRMDVLEDGGFDIDAVKFSKAFTKIDSPFDHWALSKDKKLLHWGPIISDWDESREIKAEAVDHANHRSGSKLSKIGKASASNREKWYSSFHSYIQDHLRDMPSGWYLATSDEAKLGFMGNRIEI